MTPPAPRRLVSYRYGLLLVMACSAGVDDPNAPCSQALSQKVNFDCEQTITCKVRQGELAPSNDLVGRCVDASSQRLGTGPARNQFLTNYGRCELLSACDYLNCASSGAHGFGEMEAASITYNCQQTLACNSTKGAQTCDATLALADCVAFTIGKLDSMPTAAQQNYQAANTRCASLTGCDFVACVVQ